MLSLATQRERKNGSRAANPRRPHQQETRARKLALLIASNRIVVNQEISLDLNSSLREETGEISKETLRRIAHEHMTDSGSDADKERLQASVSGAVLTIESLGSEPQWFEFPISEFALQVSGIISGFYGKSRASSSCGYFAFDLGFDIWYVFYEDPEEEIHFHSLVADSDKDAAFAEVQRNWIQSGGWDGDALTEFSALDMDEPWLMRELSATFDRYWGSYEFFYNSDVSHEEDLPEDLQKDAIRRWHASVDVTGGDQETEVRLGRWNKSSTAFNCWLKNRDVQWKDTGEVLSKAEARLLRHVCLKLAMLETHHYGW